MWKALLPTLLLAATAHAATPATRPTTIPTATLVGFASLPADTFADGPPSGQFITDKPPINGVTPPFARQPIQGISAMLPTDTPDSPGEYLALSDNGYGTKANSADFLLSVYRVRPDFKTEAGGTGTVKVDLAFHLSDPDRKAGFPLVADAATYPNSTIPVPTEIKKNRLLTGGDFDPESFVRLPDGTFWVGDEYGPFLLHFSADGKLLEPPVGIFGEGMYSPDHPTKNAAGAKIARSAGFEGLAYHKWITGNAQQEAFIANSGTRDNILLPVLEKPLAGESGTPLLVRDDLFSGGMSGGEAGITDVRPLPPDAEAVGEMVALPAPPEEFEPSRYLTLERDGKQGDQAAVKRVVVEVHHRDKEGKLSIVRAQVIDLLHLADPHDLNRDGLKSFRFPFVTIESVVPVDAQTVLVANDNNYPFSAGRAPGKPDPTEFILVRLERAFIGK